MTIRNKTLFSISLTLLGLLAVISFASSFILNSNLSGVEEHNTRENVARVRDALMQTLSAMDTTTTSWAQWDDTCQYLRDKNRAYYDENLTPETITTMKSNIIVFINDKNQIVFGTDHDLKGVKNLPLNPEVKAFITPTSPLLHHSSPQSTHMGILETPNHLVLVVTRPIVNNAGKGAIHGTLLTGIYLSAEEIKKLSQVTHLPLTLHRVSSPPLPPDFQKARAQISATKATWVQPLNSNFVAGYSFLPDIFGKSDLLLRVDVRRDIFRQGQLGIRNVIAAIILSGLAFGAVTLLLLEGLVLSRVSRLSEEVGTISRERDFGRRVSQAGKDELSRLSTDVNGMLGALQASLEKEESNRRQIEISLQEKEVLLKEVYHRVKNNLQIISSLLSLQADAISDPEVSILFDESRNRVRSMALIHEKLYQAGDLAHVNFGEYLDNLSNTLLRSYNNKRGQVALEVQADNVSLDLDRAVPCGLIVNELITNSLKYAFPGDRRGTISIRVHALEDNQLSLVVADDGIGIPADFDADEAESIGMQLVTGLTQQLQGIYELNRENGTRWTIIFKAHTND